MTLGVLVASRYRLERLLGTGNLGNVYEAVDQSNGQRVTLKMSQAADQPRGLAARFRRELELGPKLRHPAIAQALDAGEFLGAPFLVCEYVEGKPISDWFEDSGRPFDALALTLEGVLEALTLAHAARIAHRALKPEHILVTAEGQPKILDFGLSARLEDQLAGAQTTLSSLAYLSPEQVLGERGDGRSDLYALGAILYHLAAGGPPFSPPTASQMLLSHLHQQPVPLSNLPRSVPTWLDRLARRLLMKSPADRPAGASEVLSMLRRRSSRGPAAAPALAPLLGREAEMGQLEEALGTLISEGQGGCWWLHGPPGSGKNHLLQHFRRRVAARSVEWVELDAPEGRALHWLDFVQHPALQQFPEEESLQTWSAARARVCVLRGFDQADESLWPLLTAWAVQSRHLPLLLLLVSEESPRSGLLPALSGEIELSGLTRDECARLLEERLWSPPPPEAVTWMVRVSGGNPLFLSLLLDKLEGQHLLVDGPAARWNPPPPQLEVPLTAWLARELDELGPHYADLLAIASVVGVKFPYNLIKSLYLGDEAQLEQALDHLVRAGWLQETWDGGVASHRFTHRARWQAARQLLDRRRARRLAGIVAAFLEFPQSGSADWARAADYYELAGDSKAVQRCLTQCLLLACENEQWDLARAWMKRVAKTSSALVERIFPGPWYNFGWSGLHEASGPRHLLATLLAAQGREEEAMWYLQMSLEDNLEDDPPRWVENLLLRAVFQLRGWCLRRDGLRDSLDQARALAEQHGFKAGAELAGALARKLPSVSEAKA